MLVPTEEEEGLPRYPDEIEGYGARGWCRCEQEERRRDARGPDARQSPLPRCEFFIFSLWAEMQEKEVPLYGIKRDGSLTQYPEVEFTGFDDLPSQGALSNPDDRASVKGLEDQMISAFGGVVAEIMCKADGDKVYLFNKMLRDEHVDALAAALAKYEVAEVNLNGNQLGPEGAAKLAEALKTNTTLKVLQCVRPRTPLPRTRQGAPPTAAPHRPSTPAAARRMRAQPGQQQPHRRRQGHVGRAQAGRGGEAEQARAPQVRRRPRVLAPCARARRRAPRARPSTWLVAVCCSLDYNDLTNAAKEAVRKAAGPGVRLIL